MITDPVLIDEAKHDETGSIYMQPKSIFFETDKTGYVEIPADIQKQLDDDFDRIMGVK